jgi:hypothetical protein
VGISSAGYNLIRIHTGVFSKRVFDYCIALTSPTHRGCETKSEKGINGSTAHVDPLPFSIQTAHCLQVHQGLAVYRISVGNTEVMDR